jgi:hypothetical protein
MFHLLPVKPSERRGRLMMCALTRRVWYQLANGALHRGIEVVESFFDGVADLADLDEARIPVNKITRGRSTGRVERRRAQVVLQLMEPPREASSWYLGPQSVVGEWWRGEYEQFLREIGTLSDPPVPEETTEQVGIIRDVFGNPFRPVTLELAWRTSTVTSLVQMAYEERILPGGELDKQHLAVLGDALEEAGCTERAILDHLRVPGPHVRGCWAVDLLLSKE